MNNTEFFNQLSTLVNDFPRSYSRKLNAKGRKREQDSILPYKELNDWINTQVPLLSNDFYTTSTKVTWILCGLVDFPKCLTCGKNDKYKTINVNPFSGYSSHCSISCSANDENVITSIAHTKDIRYGDPHYINREKAKETIEQHKKEDPNYTAKIIEKTRNTFRKKYGADNNMQSEKGLQEYKAGMIKAYGVEFPMQSEEIKQHRVDKTLSSYGVKWFVQTEEFKQKSKETFVRDYNGATCAAQVPEIRQRAQAKYLFENILFASKPELAYYIWLRDNNVENVIYQPDISFKYVVDGKIHQYCPDFKIANNFVEIKGSQFLKEDGTWQNPYDHTQDSIYEAKHQCALTNNVKIIYSNEYQRYIDYVDKKYGKDYLSSFKILKS